MKWHQLPYPPSRDDRQAAGGGRQTSQLQRSRPWGPAGPPHSKRSSPYSSTIAMTMGQRLQDFYAPPRQRCDWQGARIWRGPQPSPADLAPKKISQVPNTHPTSSTAADWQQELLNKPRLCAMVWSKVGHTRPRSNAARLLADPMRKARVASRGLGRCGCASRPCKRTIGGQEPSMSPRTPRTIQARAAWRRRHNRNRRPQKPER